MGNPMTYVAKLGADYIAFLTNTGSVIASAGLLAHVEQPEPGVMVFDDTVARALRELPEDWDGHFDGLYIWIGGTEHPVDKGERTEAAPVMDGRLYQLLEGLVVAGMTGEFEDVQARPDGLLLTLVDGSSWLLVAHPVQPSE